MKLKHYIIFIVILIAISSLTAVGGYFYGSLMTKKKAELDKEAAIKGAIFDAREKLNKEALEKANEVIGESLDKNSTEAKKAITDFYDKIQKEDYEGAYGLLSSDYKRTLYSPNGLKKDFAGAKELKVNNIEYRSSGETTALFSVTLEKTLLAGQPKTDTYFVHLSKDLTETWKIDSTELKDKNQSYSTSN